MSYQTDCQYYERSDGKLLCGVTGNLLNTTSCNSRCAVKLSKNKIQHYHIRSIEWVTKDTRVDGYVSGMRLFTYEKHGDLFVITTIIPGFIQQEFKLLEDVLVCADKMLSLFIRRLMDV